MLSVNQRSIKSHRLLLSIFVKIWTHFTIQDEIDAKGVILDDVYSDVIGAEGDAGVDDIDVNVDDDIDFDALSSEAKSPRKRNKNLISSLNPIENFKAYPGRPGYNGPLSTVFRHLVRLASSMNPGYHRILLHPRV